MRCYTCQYDLRHQPPQAENRCPECGRAFDPRNPRTYLIGHPGEGKADLRAWMRCLLIFTSVFWLTALLYIIFLNQ